MRFLAPVTIAALGLLCFAMGVMAHPGGLNAQGCHNNKKTGEYHCHGGASTSGGGVSAASGLSGAPVSGGPPVKKSSSGICHAQGTSYYANTKNFSAFPDLESCISSGGRMPKR